MKKLIYPLFIIIASSLWGMMGYFRKNLGFLGFSSTEISFLRIAVGAFFISLFFLIFNRNAFKVKFKDLWCFIGTGSISVLGTTFFYFYTMENASLSTACVFLYTSPIFIIVLSRIIFKEKITLIKLISLIVVMGGCFLCSMDSKGFAITPLTVLTGLLSGLSYGLYSIFSRFAMKKGYATSTILAYTFIFAFIAVCFIVPYKELGANIALNASDFKFYLYVLGVGLVSCVAPYGFYTIGLKGISNGKAGVIACLEIVVALLVGLIAFSEIPSIYNIIGIILVFVAVIIQEIKFVKNKEEATINE